MGNYYLSLLANSDNEVDCVAEAKKIAEDCNVNSVTVYQCGTQRRVALVFADGSISFTKKGSDDVS